MFNIKAIKEDFPSRCDGTNLLSSLFEEEKRLATEAEEKKEAYNFHAILLTLHEGKENSFVGIHPVSDLLELFIGTSFNPEFYIADYMLFDNNSSIETTTSKLLSCIKEDPENDNDVYYENNFPVSYSTFQQLKKHGFRLFSSIPVTTRKLIISSTENESIYDNVYYHKRFSVCSFLSYFQLYTLLFISDIELIAENVNHQERHFSVILEVKCLNLQEPDILKKIRIKGGTVKFIL